MSTDQTPALARATHALSEWLNDNAPIGEQRYAKPARAAVSAALHDPDDPDFGARLLYETSASFAAARHPEWVDLDEIWHHTFRRQFIAFRAAILGMEVSHV